MDTVEVSGGGFEMGGSDDSKKRFYRPKDLIEMGYGSRATVYRKLDNGTIPSIRLDGSVLVPRDEFDALPLKERDRSMPCTVLAPHSRQRHRCVPLLVLPLRFISPPQDGHCLTFILTPVSRATFPRAL